MSPSAIFPATKKKYYKQEFKDEYELLSLSGNISYLNDSPVVHAHLIMSKTDYSLIGGHCFSGKVAITVEIYIHKFDKVFHRAMDAEIGLNLIQF
jgi:predicted DNA-binding protein with PD1-like motif